MCLIKMPRCPRQLAFVLRTHGGARPGAGRKRTGPRAQVPHRVRPALAARHPVHVTLRVTDAVGRLRRRRPYAAIRDCLQAVGATGSLRVVHYAVLPNHLHLLVEAADRSALTRGMQGLSIRLARALNRLAGHRGRVFADRYHARMLRTPLEARRALVYVLNNARRHGLVRRGTAAGWLDPYSSAAVFDGWRGRVLRPVFAVPVLAPRSWLLRLGWRRHGLLDASYVPG
jgi:REP element-mobilizing transposase RayT